MKITTLVAASVLAVASTAAVAENANVTTDSGEIVMVEKNQVLLGGAAMWGAVGIFTILAVVAEGGTN